MAIYEGAGVALITPFKANGEVNYDKLEEIVEEQIAGGTDAIVACGTTGEASTMTHEEHLDVIKFVCEVTKKRIPVIAGTGSNCTETAIYLSQEAEKNGADGLLVVSPYYNKATQKGLTFFRSCKFRKDPNASLQYHRKNRCDHPACYHRSSLEKCR